MDASALLSQLKAERDRIDQAIAALESLDGNQQAVATQTKTTSGGRRTMSAAARKRISMAAKKRWAAIRRQKKA
jgi:hypothetical protein